VLIAERRRRATGLLEDLTRAVQEGERGLVEELVPQAIAKGFTAQIILDDGLLRAMHLIDVKFKNNEVFIPEVLLAARALNTGISMLGPLLRKAESEKRGKVIIGTVKGDMHDIGKNLVCMTLEGKGFEVIDLDVNVSTETFVRRVKQESGVKLVALSALLTTSLPELETTVRVLTDSRLRKRVKVLVGGSPVTQEFADHIGADAYASDAFQAAEVAVQLTKV
jgi:5-methyltetrahydrofolate--homocysteine methyltransferase